MNVLTGILIKIGLALISVLPVERIVALMLNKLLDKVDHTNLDKATKTAQHLTELSALFGDILEDKQLTEEELTRTKEVVLQMRKDLLAIWAKGESGKGIQNSLWYKEYSENPGG